ncbi:MAG: hypothetical protein FWD48_01185 [Oscillospiraceae bacterium]|nr:hypothetical protein [Oscillospiraceae bacterium]
MTDIVLLNELKKYIEAKTQNIILDVRPLENEHPIGYEPSEEEKQQNNKTMLRRALEVHLMGLPNKEKEKNYVPYILAQFLEGDDTQTAGEEPDSTSKIRLIVCTYSDNDSKGAYDVLNILSTLRIALLKERWVGEQFALKMPLEYMVYPNDWVTPPYFAGEMILTFEKPIITQEVDYGY